MEEAQAIGPAQATAGAVCWYARCRAGLKKPLVCSQCKAAAYCSKDCQVKDWKAGHKQACKGKMKTQEEGAEDCGRERSGQGGVPVKEPHGCVTALMVASLRAVSYTHLRAHET